MRTITVEIINERVLNLLRQLETLKLIRIKKDVYEADRGPSNRTKYKGAMKKQSLDEVDRQLRELRNEWT